jgi:endonuclease/exonuclease/phosphatase family metal-dependent hydrolase
MSIPPRFKVQAGYHRAPVWLLLSALASGLLAISCATSTTLIEAPAALIASASATCRHTVGANSTAGRVSWLVDGDEARRSVQARWCATVGPAVLASAPDVPRDESAFAVISWNVHVGGGSLRALVMALREGRAVEGVKIRRFALLIQEAVRTGSAVPAHLDDAAPVPGRISATPPDGSPRDIVDAAGALGLAALYVPAARNGRGQEDRGNAIVTTEPLIDLRAVDLPFSRQRRIAIAATIAGDAAGAAPEGLRLISAHLDASGGWRRLALFASDLRTRQARVVIDAIGPGGPAALGADLNTWSEGPNEDAVVLLRRAFPQSPSPGFRTTFRSGLLLDYVFLRLPDDWRAERVRLSDRFGSDHYPVLVSLERLKKGRP